MPPPGVDERLHRDVIVGLLAPVLGNRLYDHGMVPGAQDASGATNPGSLPAEYTVLSIERDPALLTRTSGRAHQSAWALTLESASSRHINNVRLAQAEIATVLEGVRLVIDGRESTPVTFESAVRADSKGGRFAGTWVATYVL